MKYLISYVLQGSEQHRFMSEVVDLDVFVPLYTPDPSESEVEKEFFLWMKKKQHELNEGESLVILKTMRV